MAKILIDGRFVGVGDSISRYTLELTKEILKLDKENDYTLLVRPEGEECVERYEEIVQAPNCQLTILDIPHYSMAEQKELLKFLNQEKFDLVHFTQFNHPIYYKGDYVVTIHDLTLIGHLHRQRLIKRLAYNVVMKSAIRDSKKIITISKASMVDIQSFCPVQKEKIDLIYHGLDLYNFNLKTREKTTEIEKFKKKYKIGDPYILYTGMWKKHKNIIRLLKSFEALKLHNENFRSGENYDAIAALKLVIVGKIDQKEPEVISEIERINSELAAASKQSADQTAASSQQQKVNQKPPTANCQPVITTGFIDDDELPLAYAGALAYCIPSLAEGFGWPPLEAMACGTPVIASKESCIPEILGDAPLYFDPYNIEDIQNAISTIVSDQKLREELVKKGLEQVKKYNWHETAQKTFEIYKELLK